jgi:hypothetical protein
MALKPPMTEMLIVRYHWKVVGWHSPISTCAVKDGKVLAVERSARSIFSLGPNRYLAFDGRNHGRKNASELPNAVESLPARIAPVGRNMQQLLEKCQRVAVDAAARDTSEIEVPAPRAVREMTVGNCHASRVKSTLACLTAPWTRSGQRENEIHHAASVRAKAVRASALWTNHVVFPRSRAPRIAKTIWMSKALRA